MNADETWQKACEIVGFKANPHSFRIADWQFPNRGDPAAAMKMLEWLLKDQTAVHLDIRSDHVICNGYGEHNIPAALAAAVVATQEQSR